MTKPASEYTEADCPYSVKLKLLGLRLSLALENNDADAESIVLGEIYRVDSEFAGALKAFDGDWADWLIHQRELTEKAHKLWLEEEHQANLDLPRESSHGKEWK